MLSHGSTRSIYHPSSRVVVENDVCSSATLYPVRLFPLLFWRMPSHTHRGWMGRNWCDCQWAGRRREQQWRWGTQGIIEIEAAMVTRINWTKEVCTFLPPSRVVASCYVLLHAPSFFVCFSNGVKIIMHHEWKCWFDDGGVMKSLGFPSILLDVTAGEKKRAYEGFCWLKSE